MKLNTALRAAYLVISLLVSGTAMARTAYVDDKLEITLRTGESTRNSIVRMLASGERLDVASVNDDTGYAKVTTSDGKEGYVLARFVTYEPVARDRLVAANRRLERNKDKITALETELQELKGENTAYSKSQGGLQSDNARLTDEIAEIRRTAASALQIAEENKNLKSREQTLSAQIEDLQARNTELAARSRQSWYLAGAGTLVAGILAGLILPRIKLKRKSSWGDL